MATKTTVTVEETARAYFQAVADRDPDAMMEMWEPGGMGHIHGLVELRAPDTYREWFTSLFRAFPDMLFEVLDVVADGDQAAVEWRATGHFDGDVAFEGLSPTGAEIAIRGCDVLTIRDGRLVELNAYMNGMEMARQLGALPPAQSFPERAMFGAINARTAVMRRAKTLLRR